LSKIPPQPRFCHADADHTRRWLWLNRGYRYTNFNLRLGLRFAKISLPPLFSGLNLGWHRWLVYDRLLVTQQSAQRAQTAHGLLSEHVDAQNCEQGNQEHQRICNLPHDRSPEWKWQNSNF